MALSDDAVGALRTIEWLAEDDFARILAAVLPDGRTIAQALDDGETALAALRSLVNTNQISRHDGPWMRHSQADELVARLETER